ncbi:U-scoloptoxin(05)-Er3a [Drosophila rhopaloa]|uniref:Uncharacterized protein LOC108051616 n=1 Tax=Drosophila rhopaloa TaxID=1041015 RepID=A0A6P4FP83_DRORH|nr:U-scoloptoxin(05)-Er3a [Drosophila rhopaloa]XP_016989250.1 U-scoloptoxin(05)-Er3a [Drosophila rhopaloa]XP_016989251.1 U-scoloptoxin(05)-Er3a [Drosophila rhopaloa]XP_016989252.1 U-scoloptoxin(05)-Er3a [Drosophila rhopaloa]XP_016989253.1 U-scoloptoxin(05)-Er3a [Drosophila rhopaloa]
MSTTIYIYAVCLALAANFISVSAIRCHQCKSHENNDCFGLVVNTPQAQVDNQYLRDCTPPSGEEAFCRKTVIKFELHDEHRIERSCGYLKEKIENGCYSADNEGYKQIVCTCNGDGCNGAKSLMGVRQVGYSLVGSVVSLVLASIIRH